MANTTFSGPVRSEGGFNVINKAVDKIPEDLDDLLKKFVVSLLKKAAAKTGNKVDDLLVAQLEKALFES